MSTFHGCVQRSALHYKTANAGDQLLRVCELDIQLLFYIHETCKTHPTEVPAASEKKEKTTSAAAARALQGAERSARTLCCGTTAQFNRTQLFRPEAAELIVFSLLNLLRSDSTIVEVFLMCCVFRSIFSKFQTVDIYKSYILIYTHTHTQLLI